LKEGAKGAYSKNEIIYFCNNDIKDLEDKIKEISLFGQRVLIAIDGIYSMKGTMAPIQAISKLCQKYSSHCYIDDAHGFGVIGDNGLGVLESIEKDERANFTYVGSFSKPCSNPVAFIASNIDIETKVGGLVYSGPPSNIHIIASLRYFNEFTSNSFIEKRKRIQINSEYLHNFCYKLGLESFSQSGSSILTLKIFPHNVEKIIESFYQSNIFLKAAIYPVVRKGDEILRFTITSNHSDSDIQHLCYAIEQYQDLIKGKNN
jgi:7-keto-8-aminopelargonate synthetase-like enzyme